jgi:hypothetical protein
MDGEASLAECSLDHLMEKMIGLPARGANDALAAMDWIIRHGPHGTIELNADGGLWARVGASLVNAVRDYLASPHEAGLETQFPLRT